MSQSTSPSEAQGADLADLSYEQARDELVALVARIESGQVPLEEAMSLWERGEALAAHCQAKLDAAQHTLDRATSRGDAVGGDSTVGEDGDSTDDEDGDSTDDAVEHPADGDVDPAPLASEARTPVS